MIDIYVYTYQGDKRISIISHNVTVQISESIRLLLANHLPRAEKPSTASRPKRSANENVHSFTPIKPIQGHSVGERVES